jgi:hypothetical protein
MKQTINFSQFHDAFWDHNRLDNFSYEGLKALFEWLEELDDSCGTETELDVVALCCEFSEYADLEEIQGNYDTIESLDDLRDHTTVITFDSGIIIQDF